jgi:hypothetical protein
LATGLAQAAGITVGAGATVGLGGGKAALGCGDLEVAGNFDMGAGSVESTANVNIQGVLQGGSGAITLGGDWVNEGMFSAGNSLVTVGDDCGDGMSSVVGDTTFQDLSVISQSGKQVSWEQGSTTRVLGDLVLRGAGGKLLGLLSSAPGQPWFLVLDAGGAQDVSYVRVEDSRATLPGQYMAPGPPVAFDSTDGGNNFRWFLNDLSYPIPAISEWGLLLLLVLMLVPVLARGRRPRRWASE